MRDISLIFHLQKSSTVLFILLLRAFLSLNARYSSSEAGNSPSLRSPRAPSVPSYFTFADLGSLLTILPGQKVLDVASSRAIQHCCGVRQRAEYKTCAAPAPCYTSYASCLPAAQHNLQCSSYLVKTSDQKKLSVINLGLERCSLSCSAVP